MRRPHLLTLFGEGGELRSADFFATLRPANGLAGGAPLNLMAPSRGASSIFELDGTASASRLVFAAAASTEQADAVFAERDGSLLFVGFTLAGDGPYETRVDAINSLTPERP